MSIRNDSISLLTPHPSLYVFLSIRLSLSFFCSILLFQSFTNFVAQFLVMFACRYLLCTMKFMSFLLVEFLFIYLFFNTEDRSNCFASRGWNAVCGVPGSIVIHDTFYLSFLNPDKRTEASNGVFLTHFRPRFTTNKSDRQPENSMS